MLSEASISQRRPPNGVPAFQHDALRQRWPPLRDARSFPQRPKSVAGTLGVTRTALERCEDTFAVTGAGGGKSTPKW